MIKVLWYYVSSGKRLSYIAGSQINPVKWQESLLCPAKQTSVKEIFSVTLRSFSATCLVLLNSGD